MKYNFDTIPNRRGSTQIKWRVKDNELPMWVADMDFETAPKVKEAIINTANLGVFGYNDTNDEFYDAYVTHWNVKHHTNITKDNLIYVTGVIAALDIILKYIPSKNDNVILLTPVYNAFFNCIKNNELNVLESHLIYKDYKYEIDFKDLEEKLSYKNSSVLILCNPHNPIGKIWSKEDISRVIELCKKYDVLLISDEIHCDIVSPGKEYNAIFSFNNTDERNTIALVSPSKIFGLAGLHTACIMIKDRERKEYLEKEVYKDDVGEANSFAVSASIACYRDSEDWIDEVNKYIESNRLLVKSYLEEHIKELKLIDGEATYLLWIDISKTTLKSELFAAKLREETGLYILPGKKYGEIGDNFIRINIATSKDNVIDALHRLDKFVKSLK